MEVIVREGDSLWGYSQLFGVNVQLIVDSNPDVNPSQLTIGQRIKIPGYVTVDYRVVAGDSLWSIANRRHISVESIKLVNANINPNALKIGQVILVPLRITWRLVQGKQNYDYETMKRDLTRLQNVYPFIQMPSIGNSVLGNEIPEVLVGSGNKRVHYNGAFHANEWITTPVIMTFLNDYLLSLTNNVSIRGLQTFPLYQETMLSIVPMVNPDGVNLVLKGPPSIEPYQTKVVEYNNGNTDFKSWKANINGVDLNDQFPAEWEKEKARRRQSPGPRDYPGESPLSQQEAIAMAALTRKRDFQRVLAFHTQGKVIYWGFENLEPPESETIVKAFSRVSGYEPVQTIDSYAGFKDWFIQDWRRPGFTVELGMGINPLPLSQFDEIYEDALGILLAGLYM
ncbi:M14 family metallopeptidase [Peribacillus sp. NPDC096379]|uniref:M14 family metallopeptidase n=1 Tax=Peribacillus sp. NPDC096379 TaxID=3364393 RepID=UPI00382FB0C3